MDYVLDREVREMPAFPPTTTDEIADEEFFWTPVQAMQTNSPTEAYWELHESLIQLLTELTEAVDQHAPAEGWSADWGMVGDLAQAHSDIAEVIQFMRGECDE